MSRIALMVLLLVTMGTPVMSQVTIEAARAADVEARAERLAREAGVISERLTGAVQVRAQSGARVTYTLSGRIPSGSGTTPGLPIGIVNAVRDDTHLTSLNVSSRGAATGQFNAMFGFADLAEFDSWYSTQQAQDLHRAVERAAGPEGSVQVNLSVNQGSASSFGWGTMPIEARGYGINPPETDAPVNDVPIPVPAR